LWRVKNLLLVPSFAFPPSAIIKRKPLAATARRAGWVGCNIALNRIAPEARIALVITRSSGRESAPSPSRKSRESQSRLTSAATIIVPPEEVRAKYKRVKPLENISVTQRGWTLDVLNIVRRLCDRSSPAMRDESAHSIPSRLSRFTSAATGIFTTAEVYAFERELEKLHPDNSDKSRAGRHVRDNPVKDFVSRGKNPPAASSVTRHRITESHWSWRMEIALTFNPQPTTLNHFAASGVFREIYFAFAGGVKSPGVKTP
jgi:type II restriction enzyme